jgi:hypothetical protein
MKETIKEASVRLGIDRQVIWRAIQKGKLSVVGAGTTTGHNGGGSPPDLLDPADVDTWAAGRRASQAAARMSWAQSRAIVRAELLRLELEAKARAKGSVLDPHGREGEVLP